MGTLYTAPYSYRGVDRLDITRQGNKRLMQKGQPAPGEIMAPSDAILWPALRQLRQAATPEERHRVFLEYGQNYQAEMITSYRRNTAAWLDLAKQDLLTLVCFCVDVCLCHRSLAAVYLCKVSVNAMQYAGEREPHKKTAAEPLFEKVRP